MINSRHGYPSLFFERQELLQILHKRITRESNVLTKKKIVDIQANELGVKVITSDGDVYEGDIVVGADGVNSTVRRCMWKDVESKHPNLVAKESTGDTAAPTHFWLH